MISCACCLPLACDHTCSVRMCSLPSSVPVLQSRASGLAEGEIGEVGALGHVVVDARGHRAGRGARASAVSLAKIDCCRAQLADGMGCS